MKTANSKYQVNKTSKNLINSAQQKKDLKEIQWQYMVEEINSLETQIHIYSRLTPQVMSLALIGTGAVITYLASNHFNQYTGRALVIIAPLIQAALGTYQHNVAAQIAAMAEQRDRLYIIMNNELDRKIFLGRIVSDNRRGSKGTLIFLVIGFIIVMTTLILGWFNVWYINTQNILGKSWWFWGWLLSAIITICSIFFSYIDILQARIDVNNVLDLYVGAKTRPKTAPSPKDKWFTQLVSAITINKSSLKNLDHK